MSCRTAIIKQRGNFILNRLKICVDGGLCLQKCLNLYWNNIGKECSHGLFGGDEHIQRQVAPEMLMSTCEYCFQTLKKCKPNVETIERRGVTLGGLILS